MEESKDWGTRGLRNLGLENLGIGIFRFRVYWSGGLGGLEDCGMRVLVDLGIWG